MKKMLLLAFALLAVGTAQAQRKTETVETPKAETTAIDKKTIKRKVAIGRFSNETQYAKGIFYDRENDPMGKQALDILSAKLAASDKFILLERGDLAALLEESQNGGTSLSTIGADYLIIGSITQFGRKNTGKSGVFSTTKTQTVEAAVSIRLVDVSSGLIIYSDEAKGIRWEDSRDFLINKMAHNTDLRTRVKWEELFRFGKNIQVTFMDFFGLPDRYNYSGTNDARNWKLRLPLNYKDEYYKTLQRAKHDDKKDPTWWQHIAMNVPELLERAVISKAMNEGKGKESVQDLADRLHHWADVLYEPDDKTV